MEHQIKREGEGLAFRKRGASLASSPACVRTGGGHSAVGRREARTSFRKNRHPQSGMRSGRRVLLDVPVPAAAGLGVRGC